MSNILPAQSDAFEKALIGGDLSRLSDDQRLSYYKKTCESLGLNPLTNPFAYINLNGKLTLYCTKSATEQLRNLHSVSLNITSREKFDDVYVVTARAKLPNGREDEATGAVTIARLQGDALANAYMKAETKAKRRVTLSICGLGMLDESEVETIQGAVKFSTDSGGKIVSEHTGSKDAPSLSPQVAVATPIAQRPPYTIPFKDYKGKTIAQLHAEIGSEQIGYYIEHLNQMVEDNKGAGAVAVQTFFNQWIEFEKTLPDPVPYPVPSFDPDEPLPEFTGEVALDDLVTPTESELDEALDDRPAALSVPPILNPKAAKIVDDEPKKKEPVESGSRSAQVAQKTSGVSSQQVPVSAGIKKKPAVKNHAPDKKKADLIPNNSIETSPKPEVTPTKPAKVAASPARRDALLKRSSDLGLNQKLFKFLGTIGESMYSLSEDGLMAGDKFLAEQINGEDKRPGAQQ
jgi:hypothetical protein